MSVHSLSFALDLAKNDRVPLDIRIVCSPSKFENAKTAPHRNEMLFTIFCSCWEAKTDKATKIAGMNEHYGQL